jgi:predicted ATPase
VDQTNADLQQLTESRRLDGMPLAIELAATRVRALSVAQIAQRLDRCFEVLVRGNRGELPRHQTLEATIDRSVGLLSPSERDLFVGLAVFAGGWSLQAAESVCTGSAHERAARPQDATLDLLVRLVEKSLVVAAPAGSAGNRRFRFLETVRQYTRANLQTDTGKEATLRGRHARCYLGFAQAIEPQINTASRVAAIGRLDVEHDNLRAALEWGLRDEPDLALRLAGSVRWFWFHRGYWTEDRGWLAEALKAAPSLTDAVHATARAKALLGSGVLSWTQEIALRRAARSKRALPSLAPSAISHYSPRVSTFSRMRSSLRAIRETLTRLPARASLSIDRAGCGGERR